MRRFVVNLEISNTDDIHSCVTPRKQNISVQTTSTPLRLKQLITTLPLALVELPKTTQLPPVGKEYLCFQVDNKSPHAAQCVKSRILNKAIDSILSIDTFEQQCVVIKCMLQPPHLLKDQSQNAQSRRSGEKTHHIYTTYKNTVMPHGSHIYAKASDIANETM